MMVARHLLIRFPSNKAKSALGPKHHSLGNTVTLSLADVAPMRLTFLWATTEVQQADPSSPEGDVDLQNKHACPLYYINIWSEY